ncbi:arginine deiminase-related protein [Zoogloeaceae bacterium G21618-S1]|nr:arginine deiminase-related protein [Zoogloeaceae bacterium G21618-S1]
MKRRSAQAPASIIMIRPHHFWPNAETATDNAFQRSADGCLPDDVARAAYNEMTRAAEIMQAHGVRVHVFEDSSDQTPDSVFPNNWFSTHPGGHVAVYPMFAANRRRERRTDIIEMLKREYRVQEVVDYSGLEPDGLFLEGTGAMVLDHTERIAYTVQSNRADPLALERFCSHFGYEPMVFRANDAHGVPVYHTNVLMCIATDFVMIGLDMVSDPARRTEIVERITGSGRFVIALSNTQIAEFAGNAIELQGNDGRILALSARAHASLTPAQRELIESSVDLVPLDVPTIEMAGGSVRCMMAGVHLAKRPASVS